MAYRSIYLAKYGGSRSQRAHFAIFIPNGDHDRSTLAQDFTSKSSKGTIIHVIGEPVMAGYALEIKRNYECNTSRDLRKLVHLGYVDTANIHEPTSKSYVKEFTTRGILEGHAATVVPPPRGQNIRAPIDGVSQHCREKHGYAMTDKIPGQH
jgi:hypothetical protein